MLGNQKYKYCLQLAIICFKTAREKQRCMLHISEHAVILNGDCQKASYTCQSKVQGL